MKIRPILFSTPMILALLAGRKTQTRRLFNDKKRKDGAKLLPELLRSIGIGAACPYGEPGDQLWVREAWAPVDRGYMFRASPAGDRAASEGQKWKPSIFMPREASRITLDLKGVALQRLHEISEADALAEGVCEGDISADDYGPRRIGYMFGPDDGKSTLYPTAREAYLAGWETIHGAGAAKLNPWLWALKFPAVTL